MKIELVTRGFIEYLDNEFVEKICCSYDGPCIVHYYHKPPQAITIECEPYNSQFGYPVTNDGKILFVSSWENGLTAYDIATNEVLWKLKGTRIKAVYVYATYVVAIKYCTAILKLDLHTGEVLEQMKSGTVECSWELQPPYILVDTFRGKLSIIDTEKMSVVKAYKGKDINPNQCLSFVIQGFRTENNTLAILGVEDCPNRDMFAENQKRFNRIIDTNLYGNI